MVKTERSKQLIEQALRSMPQDFKLRDARYHMSRALAEIHKVESKKAKRQAVTTPRQQWEMDLKSSKLINPAMNGQQKIDYLKQIDELISTEKEKIDSIDNPQSDSIDNPQSKDLFTD